MKNQFCSLRQLPTCPIRFLFPTPRSLVCQAKHGCSHKLNGTCHLKGCKGSFVAVGRETDVPNLAVLLGLQEGLHGTTSAERFFVRAPVAHFCSRLRGLAHLRTLDTILPSQVADVGVSTGIAGFVVYHEPPKYHVELLCFVAVCTVCRARWICYNLFHTNGYELKRLVPFGVFPTETSPADHRHWLVMTEVMQ